MMLGRKLKRDAVASPARTKIEVLPMQVKTKVSPAEAQVKAYPWTWGGVLQQLLRAAPRPR